MVLALIFAFLMGIAIIVLISYTYKNQRLGLPLINNDVILSALLVIVLLFLTLQQYIVAIIMFAAGGLLFLYLVKKNKSAFVMFNEEPNTGNIQSQITNLAQDIEQKEIKKVNAKELSKKKEIKKKAKKR